MVMELTSECGNNITKTRKIFINYLLLEGNFEEENLNKFKNRENIRFIRGA